MAYHCRVFHCCVFLLLHLSVMTAGERTKDKMFESINGTAACFRRLNGTHQVGCASSRSGNVGVIHLIAEKEDLTWLLETGEAGPYMATLHPDMFTREVLMSLKSSGKVSGVLLANNGSLDRPVSYSPEDSCPNRYSGLSSLEAQTCSDGAPWNRNGSALLQVDWGFPIFYLKEQETIDKVYECFQKHNAHDKESQKSRALCALEMNAFMYAAVDSATCVRRSHLMTNFNPVRYCDPLGDKSVWSTLFPRSKASPPEWNSSLTVVAARLDSTSMFDDVVPGAITPSTGVVTLLAAANLLSLMLPLAEANNNSNVLFLLLNGESYDYIGSSRVLYDMKRGEFPMAMDPSVTDQPPPVYLQNISLFVELSQLSADGRNTVFLHRPPASNSVKTRSQLSEFVSVLQEMGASQGLSFTSDNVSSSLPPASLQTFLKEDPDLPGIVLADHGPQFTNRYYHSLFDDSNQLQYVFGNGSEVPKDSIQAFIANVSTALAKTLYRLMTGKNYTGQYSTANVSLVDELLHCYLETMNCSVFRASMSPGQKLPERPPAHYVGVSGNYNLITVLTAQALAMLTGERTNASKEECHSDQDNQVFQNIWMSDYKPDSGNDTGVCVRTTMNYSLAVSPAFLIDDYDWRSGQYSTWTESIWVSFSVRMFLKPSAAHEVLTLSIGVVVLAFSFLVVYFVNNKSAVLFGNSLAAC